MVLPTLSRHRRFLWPTDRCRCKRPFAHFVGESELAWTGHSEISNGDVDNNPTDRPLSKNAAACSRPEAEGQNCRKRTHETEEADWPLSVRRSGRGERSTCLGRPRAPRYCRSPSRVLSPATVAPGTSSPWLRGSR